MNKLIYATAIFSAVACTTKNKDMETGIIFKEGNRLPGEWFTGEAYLSPLVAKDHNNEFSAGTVTFNPGARTNWHTHPKGQVLLVLQGEGLYQEDGKPAQVIKSGDVVNIPENIKHWHGANAESKMAHVAITNYKGEEQVTWLEPVTETEYKEAHNIK